MPATVSHCGYTVTGVKEGTKDGVHLDDRAMQLFGLRYVSESRFWVSELRGCFCCGLYGLALTQEGDGRSIRAVSRNRNETLSAFPLVFFYSSFTLLATLVNRVINCWRGVPNYHCLSQKAQSFLVAAKFMSVIELAVCLVQKLQHFFCDVFYTTPWCRCHQAVK